MNVWELIAYLLVLASAIVLCMAARPRVGKHRSNTLIAVVAVGSVVISVTAAAVWGQWKPKEDDPAEEFLPARSKGGEFATSKSCRMCHPEQYASWHESFHRTMTQVVSPQTVVAPFDNREFETWGQTYRFERRGGEFFVQMADPIWEAMQIKQGLDPSQISNPPLGSRRVVLSTGSHHFQIYWVSAFDETHLREVPIYYSIDEQRWIPKKDAILKPSDDRAVFEQWNVNCIQCHSVDGNPQLNPNTRRFDPKVAEFGIACEACHGPAANHVRRHRNPLTRYRYRVNNKPDATIVNPANCAPKVATQICGQCHSTFARNDDLDFLKNGSRYRPGDDLEKIGRIINFDNPGPGMEKLANDIHWNDGTCRVGGDEYNAFIKSPCYRSGKFSCLSCHSMHKSHPNDQLAEGMQGNHACTQCHTQRQFLAGIEEHTHHKPESSGSQCYNCHMPHTSFALFTAMRSHRIASPRVRTNANSKRPNACNLCHLNQTLQWTAGYLSDWFGVPADELTRDEKEIATSLLWLLRGDAVQRIIAAWHMGWQPAHEASGTDWQAPFLAQLLQDSYSAVRLVAKRSLRKLPGFEDFDYDFIAPLAKRLPAKQTAVTKWKRSPRIPLQGDERVLIGRSGELQSKTIDRLLKQQDETRVTIPE